MRETSVDVNLPLFDIGERVYIPQRDNALETRITGYNINVIRSNDRLIGIVAGYKIEQMVFLRRGQESDMIDLIYPYELYTDPAKAKVASRFIPVRLLDATWKLAIGDPGAIKRDSPYNINNSELKPCCANISDARLILLYCQSENGMLVHDRNELESLLKGDCVQYSPRSNLGKILSLLGANVPAQETMLK
jgi:hypothetical protein